MTTPSRLNWAVIALLMGMLSIHCGSSPTRAGEGQRSDIPPQGPAPGPVEERVRQYLVDIIGLIEADNADPMDTVHSIGRYLETNGPDIRRSVQELRQRILAMSVPDRIFYEEEFSTFFEPATRHWQQALQQFRETHPDQTPLIDGLMLYFD